LNFILFSLLILNWIFNDFVQLSEKLALIKLVSFDNIFQCAKAGHKAANTAGFLGYKEPGCLREFFQQVCYSGFAGCQIFVHCGYRISVFPESVFALAQIRIKFRWRTEHRLLKNGSTKHSVS